MENRIDEDVKQKLLDSLSKEPAMVLSTAYAYAKNYVMYGEDITKAWTTAVQQASILDYVSQKARAEAYDSFKKEYENRLKADMVAMLEDLDLKIDEMDEPQFSKEGMDGFYWAQGLFKDLVQEKINTLKGDEE